MGDSIAEMEKAAHAERAVHVPTEFVMEDALVGEVKELKRSHKQGLRLQLSILGAVAALVAVPATYALTFGQTKGTNTVSVRLALISPAIFLVLVIILFAIFWIMRRWFSLWLIMVFAATLFVSACLSLLAR
ncbi:MAG: hypothetical protein ABIS59_00130 [Candidatus Saccharibacteria bacterium]